MVFAFDLIGHMSYAIQAALKQSAFRIMLIVHKTVDARLHKCQTLIAHLGVQPNYITE